MSYSPVNFIFFVILLFIIIIPSVPVNVTLIFVLVHYVLGDYSSSILISSYTVQNLLMAAFLVFHALDILLVFPSKGRSDPPYIFPAWNYTDTALIPAVLFILVYSQYTLLLSCILYSREKYFYDSGILFSFFFYITDIFMPTTIL